MPVIELLRNAQVGLEIPNPIVVEITRGSADIEQVCKDVLALTKLNYNTCIFADGQPVTFALQIQ
jgi:hypothetical protein